MTIALVGHIAGVSGDDNGVTTSSLDTTGANFIALVLGYQQGTTPTISDNKGNSYTKKTVQSVTSSIASVIAYCENANTGTGHTFTATATAAEPAICVAAFSGVKTSSSFDQENGGAANGSTQATGSITPSEDGCLIIAGGGTSHDLTSIDSGLTITDHEASGSFNWAGALAYIIQTAAGAVNATWTASLAGNIAAEIASFKSAGAPTGVFGRPYYDHMIGR